VNPREEKNSVKFPGLDVDLTASRWQNKIQQERLGHKKGKKFQWRSNSGFPIVGGVCEGERKKEKTRGKKGGSMDRLTVGTAKSPLKKLKRKFTTAKGGKKLIHTEQQKVETGGNASIKKLLRIVEKLTLEGKKKKPVTFQPCKINVMTKKEKPMNSGGGVTLQKRSMKKTDTYLAKGPLKLAENSTTKEEREARREQNKGHQSTH